MNYLKVTVPVLCIATRLLAAPEADRWELSPEGGIQTDLAKLTRGQPHADHLEMGGRTVNAIIRWNVTAEGRVALDRWVRWPMLREKKDDTHAAANFSFRSSNDPLPLNKWTGFWVLLLFCAPEPGSPKFQFQVTMGPPPFICV